MIGQTIAHYQVVEKLGEGGMGVVYKARDTHLDRFVAIKLLPPEKVADPERKRRFVQEAKAASALNHPNIITIYDIAAEGGREFIAMEYVSGKTLAQMVAGQPLPASEAVKYAVQAADALAAAHAAGIVHRDLKPANIMVTEEGWVKVLDFGLAKLTEAGGPESTVTLTAEGAIVGTVAYMSPEQAEGKRLDARTDIFSFGAVLYEMVSGRRAFGGETAVSALAAVLRGEPPPLREAPTELASIVHRCLRKDPRERYQGARELKAALEELRLEAPDRATQPAIAVLPFANLSADKENEYFSDGLAEEIINALTKLPGLRVTARTSAFAFRGKEQDVGEIGAKLRVGHILEGSVRKAGNRIRVTAQLINVADGYHLWSERFDREMTDVFAVQDDICRAIVDKLRVQLAPDRPLVKRYTGNVEAYNLYLKGCYHTLKFTPESLAKGREYFQQAVAADSDYALAYAGLAMYHLHVGAFGIRPPREAWLDCREAALKALELDDQLALAYAIRGVLRAIDFDWEGSQREFRRALELDPDSPEVWAPYDYYWLVPMRRLEEAVAAARRNLERDPLSPFLHFRLGYRFYLQRQFDLAIEVCGTAIELDPDYLVAHLFLGSSYVHKGMLAAGVRALEKAVAFAGGNPVASGALGYAYARAGRTAEAHKLLEQLQGLALKTYVLPSSIALIHFGLGEIDRGLEWFQRAVEDPDVMVLHAHLDPSYDLVRSDLRYRALLRRMNLEP
jgi:serine/threonine-protein kinase